MDFNDDSNRNFFWKLMDETQLIATPSYIKNIFKYSNFDNIGALKQVSMEKDFPFEKLEHFVRSKQYKDAVSQFIAEGADAINFYGTFQDDSAEFCFTIGDVYQIRSLVNACKNISVKEVEQFKRKISPNSIPVFDLEYESMKLKELLCNHTYPSNLKIDPNDIMFEITSHDSAQIKCLNCANKIKVKKTKPSRSEQQCRYQSNAVELIQFFRHADLESARIEDGRIRLRNSAAGQHSSNVPSTSIVPMTASTILTETTQSAEVNSAPIARSTSAVFGTETIVGRADSTL